MTKRGLAELAEVLEDLDSLLKNPDVGVELNDKGVNTSLAMTIVEGLRAYVRGDKQGALLELGTATEEIATRMAAAAGHPPS